MSTLFDTAFISFYISFLCILGMISLKSFEIKSGKKYLIFKIAEKADDFVKGIYSNVIKLISYINKKSAIALIQWIAYYILSWARSIYIWAHKKAHAHPPSRRVIDMVRGRGEINKNGNTSFYLRRIAQDDEV